MGTNRRLTALGLLAAIVLMWPFLGDLDFRQSCVLASVVAGACLYVAFRVAPRGPWSSGPIFLLVLTLFHMGLVFLYAAGLRPPDVWMSYIDLWFGPNPVVREAILLCALGVASFTAAYALSSLDGKSSEVSIDHLKNRLDRGEGRVASRLGFTLVVLGSLIFFAFVYSNAPDLLLGGSRQQYFERVEGSGAQGYGTILISFGGLLLAVGERGRLRRNGLLLLGLFGLWALSVGARSAILYALVAMVIALARIRRMPNTRYAVGGVVLGLMVIGLVGQTRLAGESRVQDAWNPLIAIAEMGGSIRPLIENVEYRRVGGEEPLGGETYVAFVERAAEGALGIPRPDGLTDPRIAGNEFRGRLDGYQIGYSAIAEAYRNWGAGGVFGVFFLLGMALGRLDRWKLGKVYPAFVVGFVSQALLFHVRQPSVTVMPTLMAGTLVLGMCVAVTRVRQARVLVPAREG